MKDFHAELQVNKQPVELNKFAEHFLVSVAICAVSSLKGGEEITTLEVNYQGRVLTILVNGHSLPLSDFPHKVVTGTLTGLLSSLKGIDTIEDFRILAN
jgi:hypothetical protein